LPARDLSPLPPLLPAQQPPPCPPSPPHAAEAHPPERQRSPVPFAPPTFPWRVLPAPDRRGPA
jgi:hypothetical protein